MGRYEKCYWQSDSWYGKSGGYRAYIPDRIAGLELAIDSRTAAAVSMAERAVAELGRSGGALTDTEPLARLLLRSEAVGSSRIEGLEVPARKLLEIEALGREGRQVRADGNEARVLANIRAMAEGVDAAVGEERLSVESLCKINGTLLEGTLLADRGGALREVQNWIGGDGYSPLGAAFVPPPPALVPGLVADLVDFVNTSEFSPLVVAALAHAQFETIHPFVDGNGRAGRALTHIVMKRSGLCEGLVPPVSLVLATDKSCYVEKLTGYRSDVEAVRSFPSGAVDWISYFAESVGVACERAKGLEAELGAIVASWRRRTNPRANSAEDLLLDALAGTPVVSVRSAAELLGRSYPAARGAIESLVEKGVLMQNSKNKRSRIFVALDVIDAFTAFERSMAAPGGDTAVEEPVRAVPQRVPRSRRDR